jgi:hypothetical protein
LLRTWSDNKIGDFLNSWDEVCIRLYYLANGPQSLIVRNTLFHGVGAVLHKSRGVVRSETGCQTLRLLLLLGDKIKDIDYDKIFVWL